MESSFLAIDSSGKNLVLVNTDGEAKLIRCFSNDRDVEPFSERVAVKCSFQSAL